METSALSGLSDTRKEKENLWTKILGEIQSSDRSKLSTCQSVIVLGDNESGKTTLIAKLQGNEDPQKGCGLEYAYIEVRDDYRDEKTRLGVWVLDGDPKHCELLEFAVTERTLENTLVLLTVSMSTPWFILDQLHNYASLLRDHIDRLNVESAKIKELQNQRVRAWQSYVEPGDEMEASGPAAMKRSARSNLESTDEPQIPLPDDVLTRNLGLNVIVVVTKTDYMSTLEKEYDYKEEHFEFIQQSVRKFCLQYGASLFYTSVKEDKNCDLLYKFLVHQIYGFPFKTPALVVEKDAVFVPAGWDNEKKISILYENMHTMGPDDYYPEVIVKPQTARKAVSTEIEVQAEDENAFLAREFNRIQAILAGAPVGVPGSMPGRGDLRHSPAVQRTGERRGSSNASPTIPAHLKMNSAKKQLDPAKGGANNEGVLASFFNALLNKRGTPPGAPATPGTPRTPDKVSVARTDAAAELDRLTRAKPVGGDWTETPPKVGGDLSESPPREVESNGVATPTSNHISLDDTPERRGQTDNGIDSSDC